MEIQIIIIRFECADIKLEHIYTFLERSNSSDAMWLRKIYFDIHNIELIIHWRKLAVIHFRIQNYLTDRQTF